MVLYEQSVILYKLKQIRFKAYLLPNYSPLNRFFSQADLNLLNFIYEGSPYYRHSSYYLLYCGPR